MNIYAKVQTNRDSLKKFLVKFKQNYTISESFIAQRPLPKEYQKYYIAYIKVKDGGEKCIKIGVTSNIEDRLKKLQTGSPYKLKIISKIIAKDKSHALYIEKSFHEQLREHQLSGEWFSNTSINNILSELSK